jgi:hypothetical protein
MNFCESVGFPPAQWNKELYHRRMKSEMTREEMQKRMDDLARKYVETHDHKIIEELYRLSLELEKLEKQRAVKAAI